MLEIVSVYLSEMASDIALAAGMVVDNLLWLYIGIITGMVLGTIPGMGGVVVLIILIPFTIPLEPVQAFTLLSGALGSVTFTGSITAILINTPGTGSNAATLIDGYPLTQKGKSAMAIVVSGISSAMGAIVACSFFILTIPLIIEFALLFTPSEVFWLVLFTIIVLPLLVATQKPIYGILTAGFGALLALIGTAPQTGEPRFVYGFPILYSGLEFVSMLIGMFAVAEIVRLASKQKGSIVDPGEIQVVGSKLEGLKVFLEHKMLWFRCTLIGIVVGAIPGAGGSATAFVAYAHASQVGKKDDEVKFGEGRIEGVLAPEAANDAKDGGQLFPTLGLGIPGSSSMAVFLSGLILHGFWPGPSFIIQNKHLVIVIALSLLVSNISTSVIGIAVSGQIVKILTVPLPRMMVGIISLALAAVFITRNAYFDVALTIVFAMLGLLMMYLEISRVPFLVAFILAPNLERNFLLALRYARGDFYEAFFSSGLSLGLLIFSVLSIVIILRRQYGLRFRSPSKFLNDILG